MIETVDNAEYKEFLENTALRNRVGQALSKTYPKVRWGVDCVGGVVQFWAPEISDQFGMVVHATRTNTDIENETIRKAGELLERFNVSRVNSDFDNLKKNIRGQTYAASKGEV